MTRNDELPLDLVDEVRKRVEQEVRIQKADLFDHVEGRISRLATLAMILLTAAVAIAGVGGFVKFSDFIDKGITAEISEREGNLDRLRSSAMDALANTQLVLKEIEKQTETLKVSIEELQNEREQLQEQIPEIRESLDDLEQEFQNLRATDEGALLAKVNAVNRLSEDADALVNVVGSLQLLEAEVLHFDSGELVSGEALASGRGPREDQGEVVFGKPFSEPPEVLVFLRGFESRKGGGAQIEVKIKRVSRDGFAYAFKTSGKTRIHGARAGWLALGKNAPETTTALDG